MDSDAILEQAVIDELAADDNLHTSTIAVSVKNGVVHLFGAVPTMTDRLEAPTKVRNVGGVTRVINDLRVLDELLG